MKRKIRALLSRVNFHLGRNPKVIEYENVNPLRYIPESYQAVLILSADFELAWSWRYAYNFEDPKVQAMKLARTSRHNIPRILKLCDEYSIPITWATVGHLFLEECSKNEQMAHSEIMRIPYHENLYWRFDRGDWFDDDPCSDWRKSPEWYAPDLIKMILNSNVEHEIACHTFSHIDCRDGICPPQVIASEIRECQEHAQRYDVKLRSFVHPGHTVGNLDTISKLGFTSFRTGNVNVLALPKRHANGLWEFQSTAQLYRREGWSTNYHIKRYKETVDRAIRCNRVSYFWFHPSIDHDFVSKILPKFFGYASELMSKGILFITTTHAYATFLSKKSGEVV